MYNYFSLSENDWNICKHIISIYCIYISNILRYRNLIVYIYIYIFIVN